MRSADFSVVTNLQAIPQGTASSDIRSLTNLTASLQFVRTSNIFSVSNLAATGTVTSGIAGASNISAVANLQVSPAFSSQAQVNSVANLNGTVVYAVNKTANLYALANLQATVALNRSATITSIANISNSYNITDPTYLAATLNSVTNLNAQWSYLKSANIQVISNVLGYSINPSNPAIPKFATISAVTNLLASPIAAALCECPEWLNLLPTQCGWEVANLCVDQTTIVTGEYDLPFTLPIFRMHILAEPLGTTTVASAEETHVNLNNGVYNFSGGIQDLSKRTGTLSKQFTRKGCI